MASGSRVTSQAHTAEGPSCAGREKVPVGHLRRAPGGVAQHPPRRTYWLTMNLPLYSPTAPVRAPKPGYGLYELEVHSHTSPRRALLATAGRGCGARSTQEVVPVRSGGGHRLPLLLGGQAHAGPVGRRRPPRSSWTWQTGSSRPEWPRTSQGNCGSQRSGSSGSRNQ